MTSNPKYKDPYYSCQQDWIKVYINFATRAEAKEFANSFEDKYSFSANPQIIEQIIWLNSKIDTGGRYYVLSLTFGVWELPRMINLNELFNKKNA